MKMALTTEMVTLKIKVTRDQIQ